ncbi:MAG: adenylate kinase [Acidimicrobiia bacterium]|nr:adenylate kinase [Acidimicrobiia bacterium]
MGQPTRLVIFGRQGAGKGTQCQRLVERYGVVHISTGDMLRAERAADTELGRKAGEIMDAGGLVGDDIMIPIARHRISEPDVVASGFVLDGFPRTVDQAEGLFDALGEDPLHAVIDLDVPLDEVTTRMKARGRTDDTDEAIAQRLDLYEQETRPVLDWFDERGLLVTVDGLGTEVEVTERLVSAVDSILDEHPAQPGL